ncbi:MAG: hypothetical protein EZS28_009488 [Streblomastix strix]|uniref:Uncharacterized protein n=1 Tax=Streblomastix strix TaxID=222440 RepID=A0A5J4WJG1_9EUKA|nr:MAG: hypothetical protein EZS28_009488 [Streblomastix strix]
MNDNNEDKQVSIETKAKIEREKRFIDEFRRAANITNNRQSRTSSSYQFFFTLVSTQHLPFFLSHFGIHKERRLGISGEGINTQNESDGIKQEGNEKQFKMKLGYMKIKIEEMILDLGVKLKYRSKMERKMNSII